MKPVSHQTGTALITAGGTGGHIFPGLAVASALQAQGWQVHWLGTSQGMEASLVPKAGVTFHAIPFQGLRAKGWMAWCCLPWRLVRAWWTAISLIRAIQPQVVLGFGGYVTVPVGLAACMLRRPWLIHEQNAVPGWANRLLAYGARRVFTAFPQVRFSCRRPTWVGMPVRAAFDRIPPPPERRQEVTGLTSSPPLRVLVLGGSLGAKALNTLVSQALALMRASLSGRPEYFPLPQVIHQTGQAHIAHWQARYQEMGLSDQVNCVAFLEDVAEHMAQADLVIARAGAGTVWEIAHVGVAALFIPLPHAADDHQTRNAAFLVNQQAAWSIPQAQLSPVRLMQYLEQAQQNRHTLDDMAQRARSLAQPGAALAIASYCASYCPSLMEGTGS